MGIESAARQASCQHDVVDIGSGVAAQTEEAGGMLDDFSPDTGFTGGADGHRNLIVCPSTYHMSIDILCRSERKRRTSSPPATGMRSSLALGMTG